ncbi:hypothetical protein EB796_010309 [Bugula neritina]|uniref:Uncharacterized protein n=1 Tax=Bugula neritina TaxID=10212 RepID=A0A7J7K0A3_BUGNE|nr:hypothetical protein EB796_010309 [Bugula neritina]
MSDQDFVRRASYTAALLDLVEAATEGTERKNQTRRLKIDCYTWSETCCYKSSYLCLAAEGVRAILCRSKPYSNSITF